MFSVEKVFPNRYIKQIFLITSNNELVKDVIYLAGHIFPVLVKM